jgi:hypothetical protein
MLREPVNRSVTKQIGRYVLAGLAKRLPNIAHASLAAVSLHLPITFRQIDLQDNVLPIISGANNDSEPYIWGRYGPVCCIE